MASISSSSGAENQKSVPDTTTVQSLPFTDVASNVTRPTEPLSGNHGTASGAGLGKVPEEEITLKLKWSGKDFHVQVCGADTVGELKQRICEVTNVLPKRQKLLGLVKAGTTVTDTMLLSQLAVKPTAKIMMMGTVENEILVDSTESPDVVDDFVVPEQEFVAIQDREENQNKVRRRAAAYKMKVLNPPRPDKKLLVLDIDYTLFDHRSTAESPGELMRPYLHEFLTACYAKYDIIIWSATSMKWVEVKMRELGVLSHEGYSCLALVDHLAMITVQSERYGVFDCKPLGVLWAKFPQYHAGNTIMFDDLKRNFVMNPQNGLTIRPFRKAHLSRATDTELLSLSHYLLTIAELDNIGDLDHNRWERYMASKRQRHGG
eukprot:TRINITY_DN23691_c0_g1_i1.p1 TRINITY_DN23691_c0_g1~~TRINITY_DN23691_c0_g1_i1.p1  ORF type:complete len:376 (-),score=58.97 TRINITY_DN23691_c0_g1_i1:381-1508(-)